VKKEPIVLFAQYLQLTALLWVEKWGYFCILKPIGVMMIQIYNSQTTKKIWKYLFVATAVLMWRPVQAQVTLDSCRLWAKANYPAIEQYDLLRQSAEYSVSNAARSWIPRVTLSGAVCYQSDAANMGEMWEAMQTGRWGLRGRVRRAAESKYGAGTITTAELLKAIADESTALSTATLHRIELIQAQYELNKL
jgi:hypothetical protein